MLLSAEVHSDLWRTSQGSDLLPLPPAEWGKVGWFRFWDELTVNSSGNPIKGNNLFISEFSPSVHSCSLHSCSLHSTTALTERQKNCGSGATSWRSSASNNGAARQRGASAFISSRVYVAGIRAPPRAEKSPACESFLLTASPSAGGAGGERCRVAPRSRRSNWNTVRVPGIPPRGANPASEAQRRRAR